MDSSTARDVSESMFLYIVHAVQSRHRSRELCLSAKDFSIPVCSHLISEDVKQIYA